MTNIKNLVQDAVASPLGSIIASVGEGVAAAQNALDEGSIAAVLDIYSEGDDEKLAFLREIGYRPTFYTIPETTGEIKVALRLGQTAGVKRNPIKKVTSSAVGVNLARAGLNVGSIPKMYASTVDANYANRYGFSSDISATITFKILPVPAPEGADELRIVPNLVDKSVAEAIQLLESFGIIPEFVDVTSGAEITNPDSAKVISGQNPAAEPQHIVRAGDSITLQINAG